MKLKGCPFCGSSLTTYIQASSGRWRVVCLDCSCAGPLIEFKGMAAKKWNERQGELCLKT